MIKDFGIQHSELAYKGTGVGDIDEIWVEKLAIPFERDFTKEGKLKTIYLAGRRAIIKKIDGTYKLVEGANQIKLNWEQVVENPPNRPTVKFFDAKLILKRNGRTTNVV